MEHVYAMPEREPYKRVDRFNHDLHINVAVMNEIL